MIQVAGALIAGILLAPHSGSSHSDDYRDSIARWRAGVETDLKAEGGWLSVAGLYWLKEGETTFGSDPRSGIVLPSTSVPAKVGVVTFKSGQVSLQVSEGVAVKVNDIPAVHAELKSDAEGKPDEVRVGSLRLVVIKRGKRTGLRLYDNQSEARQKFSGLKWFAIDPAYRIKAKYVPYASPKQIPITNVLGDIQPSANPGYLVFTLGGKQVRLEAQGSGDGLFINFKDLTNGKSTYPAGRFLDTEEPQDGFVTIDFNKAYNPPCAFTNFATCPLPPKANYLPVAVPAGEKNYHS